MPDWSTEAWMLYSHVGVVLGMVIGFVCAHVGRDAKSRMMLLGIFIGAVVAWGLF